MTTRESISRPQAERSVRPAPRANVAVLKPRPPESPVKSRYTVQSLVMGLRVLEALAKNGGLRGVTELARDLGTTKWEIFRHLHTLCEQGFATRDPISEKYEVGRRLHALKDALPARYGWVHRAREDALRLRQETQFTVTIAIPVEDRTGVRIIDVQGGNQNQNVLYMLKLGAFYQLHCSAHGKLALAFGDPELLEATIGRGLPRITPKTIVSPDGLRREIKKVRERGWADSFEQAEINMSALTAPVFSAQGTYEGSIGIFGPSDQIRQDPGPALTQAVMRAAQRISEQLGGGRRLKS